MTYYDKEFLHLGDIQATLQLRNESGQTRWMTISLEQIKAILDILNKSEVTL